MKQELRKAVTRLRKLQDANFAGKINTYDIIFVNIDTYIRKNTGKCYRINVSAWNELQPVQSISFDINDEVCTNGGEIDEISPDEMLDRISQFIGYPV